MSLLVYAGSMQYVAVDLLAGGASLIAAALMTLTLNARHLFYGISMVELQLWRKNTLLSIAAGTALYMVLVQTVFK